MLLVHMYSGSYHKVEAGAASRNLQTEQVHRYPREMLTVDHKYFRTSIRQTRNIQEMNMVLSEGHYRLVICAKVWLFHVVPRDGSRVGRFEKAHVQGIETSLRVRI